MVDIDQLFVEFEILQLGCVLETRSAKTSCLKTETFQKLTKRRPTLQGSRKERGRILK